MTHTPWWPLVILYTFPTLSPITSDCTGSNVLGGREGEKKGGMTGGKEGERREKGGRGGRKEGGRRKEGGGGRGRKGKEKRRRGKREEENDRILGAPHQH